MILDNSIKYTTFSQFSFMVKTRFCPSPSGKIHIGNARTAIFSALYAQKHNGIFLLRIEDTDSARSKQIYVDAICEDLSWLGLNWQEGYGVGGDLGAYRQADRVVIYDEYLHKLQDIKRIYPCFCSAQKLASSRKIQLKLGKPPRYDGSCRNLDINDVDLTSSHTLRFMVDDSGITEFVDGAKSSQDYANKDIGDFIIKRSNGAYAFFFVNAIDDALMKVSHSIRGEDHLSNTPRQIMLLKYLGLNIPEYTHTALILGDDNKPLSKRNGSISIEKLRNDGYISIAVINYLARIGHHYDSDDLLSFSQLAADFSFDNLSKSPAQFDLNHLQHWQRLVLYSLTNDEFWQYIAPVVSYLVPSDKQDIFIDLVRNNTLLANDALIWAKISFSNVEVNIAIDVDISADFFSATLDALSNYSDYESVLNYIKDKTKLTGKSLFMPLRLLLSTQKSGPELKKIFAITDKNVLLNRVKYYQNILKV